MIKKSILFFILITVAYESIIRFINPTIRSQFTQWQENIVKAQEVLYEDSCHKRYAIVGSSLSNKLDKTTFSDFTNCSLAGLSVIDALNILEKARLKPEVLLVEENVIYRNESSALSHTLFHPVRYYINKNLKITRQAYQPIGLLAKYFSYFTNKFLPHPNTTKRNEKSTETRKKENIVDKRFSEELKRLHTEYSTPLDNRQLENQLLRLSSKVASFKVDSTKVVFFEMPVNQSLVNLYRPSQIRVAFERFFPLSENNYVARDTNNIYSTTDGVHLNTDEALQFSSYLYNELVVLGLFKK
jgi:hypothetical protein